MAGQSRVSLGPPLPVTPKKARGGELEELLQQFGPKSSATSATKARRISSFTTPTPETPAEVTPESKRAPRQRPKLTQSHSESSANLSCASSSGPSEPAPSMALGDFDTSGGMSEEPNKSNELSEDELSRSTHRPRNPTASYSFEDLKMENRRKERIDTPRRSGRNRKSDILSSDTVQPTTLAVVKRKATPSQPKLDTMRTRLRDEIAQKTKFKANSFLVANKDFFLPLLPETNFVSRLIANDHPGVITEYERLSEQPKGVTATMKNYQLDGLSFLVHLYNNGFAGILGDEMGLGKTLQTLSLFQYLEEQDQKLGVASEELRPYLVVCPLSVLNSWVTECQKWVPELKVLRFHGTVNERNRAKRVALGIEDQYGRETYQFKDRKAYQKAGGKVSKLPTEARNDSYKIIVTTYEIFQAEQAWFKHSFVWRYVVLDEGHKIKSSVTQISTALRNITSEYRLILTGTPLQNNLVELWALLAWLYPNVFNDKTQSLFKESFDLNRGQVNRKTLDDSRHLLELIMLRRMKDSPSVNLGLPPKEEVLLYVPLTPMQRFWYTRLLTKVDHAMLDELFADGKSKEKAALKTDKEDDELLTRMEKLQSAGDEDNPQEWKETTEIMRQALEKEQNVGKGTSAWQKLMNLVMQLRKCCSHPYLLPGAVPDPYYVGQHLVRASGKFILLEKLLKNSILEQGKKVLIFSGFTRTLDCCEDMLTMLGNFGQDFKFLRLDGNTARARRNLEIRLFNDLKSDYKVMLLSTRAGGLGINLTSAEDVIFLDEDWNPQITLQAEARAHRIGQTKKVTIYKLCTQGTVEEQMMGRIRKKLYLSAKITDSMKTIHGVKATKSLKGRTSVADDVPEMNTTQLKTLVRRGAQTLSHPEINVNEMLSWDLGTMMQKCRDRPLDPHVNAEAANSEVDEEQWLSVMERVECAVFDGKRYQRKVDKKAGTSLQNILPTEITREDRRKNKNTTVMIDGFAISKESLNCANWEAVPTFAGKNPRLAEPQREKRREYQHEEHCIACFDGPDVGHMVQCKSCPRTYHFDCLEEEYQSKVKGFSGFYCPQHACCECGKNTTDAGGLIYRCRWCPRGFCEDCLEWGKEALIGENLPEFEMLGEGPTAGGFYIECPECIEAVENNEEQKEWLSSMQTSYKEQHAEWLQEKEEEQKLFEKEQDAAEDQRKSGASFKANLRLPVTPVGIDDDEASPPPLTDTSIATPGPGESGLSTPGLQGFHQTTKRRAVKEAEEEFAGLHQEKKSRLNGRPWMGDTNRSFMGYFGNGA